MEKRSKWFYYWLVTGGLMLGLGIYGVVSPPIRSVEPVWARLSASAQIVIGTYFILTAYFSNRKLKRR